MGKNTAAIEAEFRARGQVVKAGESLDPVQRALDRKEPKEAWERAIREVEVELGIPIGTVIISDTEYDANRTKQQLMNLIRHKVRRYAREHNIPMESD
jgi:hypothetical protein